MMWVNIRIDDIFYSKIDRFYRAVSEFHYTYPSIFSGTYLAVSQIREVAPRIKILYSDPSLDRNTRNVRQLEQNFEPYRMMFKELKAIKQLTSQCFCKEKGNPQEY